MKLYNLKPKPHILWIMDRNSLMDCAYLGIIRTRPFRPRLRPSKDVQRLNIDGAVIDAVRGHLDPRLVQSLVARQRKGNTCWEGPILVRTPTQVGIAWMVGHVGRSAIASGGDVNAPVHI